MGKEFLNNNYMKKEININAILKLDNCDIEKLKDICELARRRLEDEPCTEHGYKKDADIIIKEVAYDRALQNTMQEIFDI